MKVSIIIPIYNAEKYLNGCLSSIAAQTHADFECLCVNNGSTDASEKIIDEFIKKDDRFKKITRSNEGKQAAARNAALKEARGDAVTFIDADDYIHPRMLELLVKTMQDTDCDLVGCTAFNTKELYSSDFSDVSAYKTVIYKDPLTALMTKRSVATTVWGRLYRKDIIKDQLFIEGIYFEDVPWTLEVMHKTNFYAQITAPLYCYFKGDGSTMRSQWTNEKTDSYIRVIRSVSQYAQTACPDKKEEIKKYISNGRVKMIMTRIRKSPDKKDLYTHAAKEIQQLYKEGLISYRGLKLRHKIALYRILHYPV